MYVCMYACVFTHTHTHRERERERERERDDRLHPTKTIIKLYLIFI